MYNVLHSNFWIFKIIIFTVYMSITKFHTSPRVPSSVASFCGAQSGQSLVQNLCVSMKQASNPPPPPPPPPPPTQSYLRNISPVPLQTLEYTYTINYPLYRDTMHTRDYTPSSPPLIFHTGRNKKLAGEGKYLVHKLNIVYKPINGLYFVARQMTKTGQSSCHSWIHITLSRE